jgi:hypothetical protein
MRKEIKENTENTNRDFLSNIFRSGEFNPHPSPDCRKPCHIRLCAVRDSFSTTRITLTTRSIRGKHHTRAGTCANFLYARDRSCHE